LPAEVTDPDDIDALLDAIGVDEPVVEDAQAEITDPDDIDALLASMDIDEPDNKNTAAEVEDVAEVIATDSEDDVNEADISETDISENIEKIENLTEAYVAPLLSADFSDLLAKSTEQEGVESELEQASEAKAEAEIDDEAFDIDDLIADVAQSNQILVEEKQSFIESETLDIGDDLLAEPFDEDTLAELLNDKESEYAVELSPDFSDQNVLADLLNDNDESSENKVSEASEINDIQELDNLDFDELLANIEEESSVANQPADFNQNHDVGDEITLADFDNFSSTPSSNFASNDEESDEKVKKEDDFVSVDSLLSASEYESDTTEPYEKSNIDVGLNEFPEFTDDVNKIDVDIDENGIAAKLDLAKVYFEIGDEDNAQVILKEVLKLGDPQQQAQAQDLLNDL